MQKFVNQDFFEVTKSAQCEDLLYIEASMLYVHRCNGVWMAKYAKLLHKNKSPGL